MNGRPRLLDLCCKQGGTSYGYWRAGFDVTAVDLDTQAAFPDCPGITFIQADALTYLAAHGQDYDLIAASPPCQAHTLAQRIQGRTHPDLIPAIRELARHHRKPYIIENVPGAPLLDPVMLCGAWWPKLRVYRHRLFEAGGGITLAAPPHPAHHWPMTKMGRRPRDGQFLHVVGNFSGASIVRQAWGVPWMTRDGMREAIPPAYTEFLGHQAAAQLSVTAGAA